MFSGMMTDPSQKHNTKQVCHIYALALNGQGISVLRRKVNILFKSKMQTELSIHIRKSVDLYSRLLRDGCFSLTRAAPWNSAFKYKCWAKALFEAKRSSIQTPQLV